LIRFITPALNEARNLPKLLSRLEATAAALGRPAELILVDDGSTDETVAVAQAHSGALAVRCVSHPTNLGPGVAFRTGFLAARALHRGGDLWCTLESDNTSDPALLAEMVRRAEGGADLVLASVYAPGGKVLGTSRTRMVLSTAANRMMRIGFGLPGVHTFTSFYRLYRGDFMLRALEAWGDDLVAERSFTCMAELLVKLHRLGARIEEVPMVLDGAQRVGTSRMRIWRNMVSHLGLLKRYLASAGFRPPGRPGSPR
jgi:dolichol-phosphate mannosyltransferase